MALLDRVRSLVPTPATPERAPAAGRGAVDVAERILVDLRQEQRDLERVDEYMRGVQDPPFKPEEEDGPEVKAILKRSTANVLPLVVSGIAQTLSLTGYRRSDQAENAPAWRAWQANGWDARQDALHRASLTYGMSYGVVLPGSIPNVTGRDATMPVLRAVSPRRMLAVYADQAADEWPLYALEEEQGREPDGRKRRRLRLYTDTSVHFLTDEDPGGTGALRWLESREHGLGLPPVVRYPCELDLEGRYVGEIEPLLTYQDMINQATFDTNMVQSFGAFVIRWIAGLSLPGAPGTAEGGEDGDRAKAREAKLQIGADRLITATDPDTKFGSLAATPLDGHLSSRDQKLRDLALRAQLPPHALLGTGTNVNAEALAATEAGLQRKGRTRRLTYGESHEQLLRLAAWCTGDRAGWEDREAQGVWGDTEARSLAQIADAIVKLGDSSLNIDPDLLLPMLPGWTQRDVEQAKEYRERERERDPVGELDRELRRQAGDGGDGSGGVPGHDPASRTPAGQ